MLQKLRFHKREPLEFLPLLGERFRVAPHLCPGNRETDNRPALLNRLDNFQCSQNYSSLDLDVKRCSEVMSHRPRDKDRAWNFDGDGHIFGDCDRDGRNTKCFNLPLNQSDRLMADRSSRCKKSKVCSFFLADCTSNAFGYRSLELLRVHVVADKAEEISCEPTDHPFPS